MANDMLLWRIATSEAGLQRGAFFIVGIPPPTMAPYSAFSKIVPRADGGDAAHGYERVPYFWNSMSLTAYSRLKRIVDSVRPGLIYVTLEINDGSSPSGVFVDVSGHPGYLQQSSESPANRNGVAAVSNVSLIINNATILNNPSNYS
jgi:hypothetical protein